VVQDILRRSCLTGLLHLKIDVVQLRHLADLPLTPAPTPPPHPPCPAFSHVLHRPQQSLLKKTNRRFSSEYYLLLSCIDGCIVCYIDHTPAATRRICIPYRPLRIISGRMEASGWFCEDHCHVNKIFLVDAKRWRGHTAVA
jgi:hypothetical protein